VDIARRMARREERRLAVPGDADEAWTIALVKAVDGHDPRRGDFVPYLRKRIFGEVRQQARDGWLSGTADILHDTATRVCRARDGLRQELHREPAAIEIAARLEMPTCTVAETLRALAARRGEPLDNDIAAPIALDENNAFSVKSASASHCWTSGSARSSSYASCTISTWPRSPRTSKSTHQRRLACWTPRSTSYAGRTI